MIPSQELVWDVMTNDVNYIDIFSFLTGVKRNFSAFLLKVVVFIRNWPACFEKVSFLSASSYCMIELLRF